MQEQSETSPSNPSAIEVALSSGLVDTAPGRHVNTDQAARIFRRSDIPRTMWIPDDEKVEIVLKDCLEGEGDWIVATPTAGVWRVVRDFWNDQTGETDEETLTTTKTREEAVDYLSACLLK